MTANPTQLKISSSIIPSPGLTRIAEVAREVTRPAYAIALKPILDAQTITTARLTSLRFQNQVGLLLERTRPSLSATFANLARLQPVAHSTVAAVQADFMRSILKANGSALLRLEQNFPAAWKMQEVLQSLAKRPVDPLELAPWRAGLIADPRMPAWAIDAWDLCMSRPALVSLVILVILAVASEDPGLNDFAVHLAQEIGDIWMDRGLKRVGIDPLRELNP